MLADMEPRNDRQPMYDPDVSFINEAFHAEHVTAEQLDALLEKGWRHFGTYFFRYSYALYELDVRQVFPLRVRLGNFTLSKSQRRVLRKNSDLEISIGPASITAEAQKLFLVHRQRFKHGIPDSLYDFLSEDPGSVPCPGMEITVCLAGEPIAVSYFDLGSQSVSGIYALFDPAYSDRSLGIFTMLKEIEFARESGKEFYYQGYSYEGNSFYDYKKRFRGTEAFDWQGNWLPAEPAAFASW
jgi:arginyl-tRNA--protein-N-Asp/Glu arginylyltransferase